MPHLPGLDGLRGLAVIGVVVFHGGFSWAGGGFLGVSTFFVLSGFLITNLLIREWDSSGKIRLGRFWIRRFRRLLPAALLTLALVALAWSRLGTPEQLANLRWDLLTALAYVANWRFYLAGTSYAELFAAPGPLQHFWSLAIEEQFYLLFPPIVIGLVVAGGRRLLTAAICVATVASIGLGLGDDIERIYYGTDTRAAELLIGALLAMWWSSPSPQAPDYATPAGGKRAGLLAVDIAGVAALAGMLWSWWAIADTSEAITLGALPIYALLTAIIIYAATQPGWVARVLSLAPLRWIGLISYGLYLYHWPVFLILDEKRLDLPIGLLFLIRMTVTTLLAIASYYWLEMPVRRGRVLKQDRTAIGTALAGALVVTILAIAVTRHPPQSTIPYADVRLEDFSSQPMAGTNQDAGSPAPATTGSTVLILGDSGAVDASPALRAVFEAAGADKVVERAFPGVGLSNPALKWRTTYKDLIIRHQPELVIIMLGGWDIPYAKKEGETAYANLVSEAVEILTAGEAKLLWLSMLPGGNTSDRAVDRIYAQIPTRFPGRAAFADIETVLRAPANASSPVTLQGAEQWPRSYVDSDGSIVLLRKPDFWHLCPTGAERLARAINRAAADLGWSGLALPGWEQGEWRSDPRYDDPKGACVTH